MQTLLSLEQIIKPCHDFFQDMGEVDKYKEHIVGLQVLFGLFLNTKKSKASFLRHLESNKTYFLFFESEHSRPLSFKVDDDATFFLGIIYFKFLDVLDINVCRDAQIFLDILQSAPIWKVRLLNASKQMLHDLSEYYRSCSFKKRHALDDGLNELLINFEGLGAGQDIAKSRNIFIRNAFMLRQFSTTEVQRQYIRTFNFKNRWKLHSKVHFDFRVVEQLPTQPFKHPTLIALKNVHPPSYFYYPAGDLHHHPISAHDLTHGQQSVLVYDIPFYELGLGENPEYFIEIHKLKVPALIQDNQQRIWIYGKTDERRELNLIEPDVFQRERSELLNWIHEKAYHIPFIRYQTPYSIFTTIQRHLETRVTLKAQMYSHFDLIEQHDYPVIQKGHLYIKKNDYDHRLTVSLKSFSNQEIVDLETDVEWDEPTFTDVHKERLLAFLRKEKVIPYLEHNQQQMIDVIQQLILQNRSFINEAVPILEQENKFYFQKISHIYALWVLEYWIGFSEFKSVVYAGFNLLKLMNIGKKIKAGHALIEDDCFYGQSLAHKKEWSNWLTGCFVMFLIWIGMNSFESSTLLLDMFLSVSNVLNIFSELYGLHTSHRKNLTVSLDKYLSFREAVLIGKNFNLQWFAFMFLTQVGFWYREKTIISVKKNREKLQLNELEQFQINLQDHFYHYNSEVQRAGYILNQLEYLLADSEHKFNYESPELSTFLADIQSLMNQYYGFMSWRNQTVLKGLQTPKLEKKPEITDDLNVEKQRFLLEAREMDAQFEQFQKSFEDKKQALQMQFAIEPIDERQLGWSWIWLYQPSTKISSGLFLTTASICALHIIEFAFASSLSVLVGQMLSLVLIAATALGVAATIYGLLQQFQCEDMRDYQFTMQV